MQLEARHSEICIRVVNIDRDVKKSVICIPKGFSLPEILRVLDFLQGRRPTDGAFQWSPTSLKKFALKYYVVSNRIPARDSKIVMLIASKEHRVQGTIHETSATIFQKFLLRLILHQLNSDMIRKSPASYRPFFKCHF